MSQVKSASVKNLESRSTIYFFGRYFSLSVISRIGEWVIVGLLYSLFLPPLHGLGAKSGKKQVEINSLQTTIEQIFLDLLYGLLAIRGNYQIVSDLKPAAFHNHRLSRKI